MNYLGIDWGSAKIGLALGDDELKIASPFKIVKNLTEVKEIIQKEEIDAVILGKPTHMSGKEDYQKSFNNFYNSLSKVISVELIDERLSTKEAVLLMQGQKHKMDEDAVAAMIILQNFFDII